MGMGKDTLYIDLLIFSSSTKRIVVLVELHVELKAWFKSSLLPTHPPTRQLELKQGRKENNPPLAIYTALNYN